MAQKQGSSKKARNPKTSQGINKGAKKTRLSTIEKVLMGKGLMHNRKLLDAKQSAARKPATD